MRDLPTSDPDAAAKSAEFRTRDEIRKQLLRDKGVPEEEIQRDDINRQNAKRIKKVLPGAGAGDGPFQDPLVNRGRDSHAPQAMPTPSLTFNGASQVDNAAQGIGVVLPPDTNGDVGPNHYVSSVNLVVKIFNKNGTVAAGPVRTSAFFLGLPASDPCRVNNDGDPIVVYDSLADRWHISQFALPGVGNEGSNFQCVALSVTGDPTGAYYAWRYTYPGGLFNDYPKVGVWPDAYHITFNQFNNAGTAFWGLGILSQDRPKALTGDPTTSVVYTNVNTIDPTSGGALPADVDGLQPPPVGMAEVIAEYTADEFGDPVDGIRYYRWVPNFITPGSSSITILPDVALPPFDARQPAGRGDIEQSGGANLDSLSDRMMHFFKYRNLGTQAAPVNSFVGNFPVNVSGVNPTSAALYQTGIRWFEMRRTGDVFTVFDQGTHNLTPGDGATGLNNWMGSIAQDNRGDIALGFSQSSTTQNADIKIAGRTVNTMNSGILNEGEALFFDALGSQTSTSNRWGDYSAMNVDPVDDCTFWYTPMRRRVRAVGQPASGNSNFQNGDALGNNLTDYVDGGGIVVQLAYSHSGPGNPLGVNGRWVTGNYNPYSYSSNTISNSFTLGAFNAAHPLMAGVTTLNDNRQNVVTPAPGATQVAAASNGNSLVAFRPVSGGRTTVGITAYLGQDATWSGHWGRLIVNARRWLGTSCAPVVLSAVSRKVHAAAGSFDVNLPLVAISGAVGVESRNGAVAGEHQLAVTFANPVTAGGVSVTSGTGSGTFSVSGAVVTINLTGVTNAQRLGVTLLGVSDGVNVGDILLPMGVLLGDTNGDRFVNAGDSVQTRSRAGQGTAASNFRSDLNTDGFLNSGDTTIVRSRSGTTLP